MYIQIPSFLFFDSAFLIKIPMVVTGNLVYLWHRFFTLPTDPRVYIESMLMQAHKLYYMTTICEHVCSHLLLSTNNESEH